MSIAILICILGIIITSIWCGLAAIANGMSDAPSEEGIGVLSPFLWGIGISLAIGSLHWIPLGWIHQ
jgi:hypothetical protein